MSWHTKTIAELSKSLHSKEVSSQELANYFLARISQSVAVSYTHLTLPTNREV